MREGFRVLILVFALLILLGETHAWAQEDSTARFTRGFVRTFTGSLQIPYHVVDSTLNRPFPLGPVEGTFKGAFYAATNIVGGVFEMGTALLPYAKYAFFFV